MPNPSPSSGPLAVRATQMATRMSLANTPSLILIEVWICHSTPPDPVADAWAWASFLALAKERGLPPAHIGPGILPLGPPWGTVFGFLAWPKC